MEELVIKSAVLIGILGIVLFVFTYKEVGLGFMGIAAGFIVIERCICLYKWFKRR